MEIHWVHAAELSEDDKAEAEGRLYALAEGHSDLIDIRLTAREKGHQLNGDREVRIACEARGREIVASRSQSDLGVALHDVLDVFEREVRKVRQRQSDRRTQRPSGPPHLGIIDRIFREEGYGFLLTDAGEKVYFHRNAVHGRLDFEGLAEGDRVGLDLEAGDEGLQATTVVEAPPGAPSP
jgi:cold shock CspA family protein/ribosome-associated translation inhibitor RaiA